MELHERLVAAREKAGFETAAEAASALGVSYSTYAGHENGSSGFRRDTAAQYARRFGVSLEWLITGRGEMTGPSPDEAELLDLYRQAPEKVRTSVLSILESTKGK